MRGSTNSSVIVSPKGFLCAVRHGGANSACASSRKIAFLWPSEFLGGRQFADFGASKVLKRVTT